MALRDFVPGYPTSNSNSELDSFDISTDGLGWVANEAKNRWFLVLRIKKPANDELNRLLQVVNEVVTAFGQSPLYAEQHEISQSMLSLAPARASSYTTLHQKRPQQAKSDLKYKVPSFKTYPVLDLSSSFHFSIGWALSAPLEDLNTKGDVGGGGQVSESQVSVKAIKLKIGNSVTSLPLLSKMEFSGGIVGT